MIEKLIEEMIETCSKCGGSGIDYHSKYEPVECDNCLGEGKVLSSDGEKLRYLILKGELP